MAACGVRQRDHMSPMVFNILVDTLVRAWLEEVYNSEIAKHGLGHTVGERGVYFYTNYGRILGEDVEWVRWSFGSLVREGMATEKWN